MRVSTDDADGAIDSLLPDRLIRSPDASTDLIALMWSFDLLVLI